MLPQYFLLNGAIKKEGYSQDRLAREIGLDPATLSRKLNGTSEFTQGDIKKICKALNIDPQEIPVYFFAS